jgi:hypothetical protein
VRIVLGGSILLETSGITESLVRSANSFKSMFSRAKSKRRRGVVDDEFQREDGAEGMGTREYTGPLMVRWRI